MDKKGFGDIVLQDIEKRLGTSTFHLPFQMMQKLQYETVSPECPGQPIIGPARTTSIEEHLRERLWFEGIEERETRLLDAYKSTFDWLWEHGTGVSHKWDSFVDWLETDSRTYWITGKAGSGKSTLMKFIYTSKNGSSKLHYRQHLERWKSDRKLIVAKFYFWASGTELQTTQAGLFRSLLHQIFVSLPQLIQKVIPGMWESRCLFNGSFSKFESGGLAYNDNTWDATHWTDSELQEMFCNAVRLATLEGDCKIFLLVDGLDEFAGDPAALISIFQDVSMNPLVKLCVSSRPWVEFEDAFRSEPSLMLQDLTYADIKHYVSSRLENDAQYAPLRARDPQFGDQLVENIVNKASGVFLWVRLVVDSLLQGLEHGDRVSDLQKRLDETPQELEALYEKILIKIDPRYVEHAAQLFALMRARTEPPGITL